MLWAAMGLVGVVVYWLAWLDAKADGTALDDLKRNGLLRALVRMDARLFKYGTWVQLLMFSCGVAAMVAPRFPAAPNLDPAPISVLVVRWFVPLAFFLAELLLILLAVQHQHDRHFQRDEAHRTAVGGIGSGSHHAPVGREGAEGRIQEGRFVEDVDPHEPDD